MQELQNYEWNLTTSIFAVLIVYVYAVDVVNKVLTFRSTIFLFNDINNQTGLLQIELHNDKDLFTSQPTAYVVLAYID